MPLYLDIHTLGGVSAEDLKKAHEADLAVQHRHGVHYLKYWHNHERGKVFCLVDAPDAEAAGRVHAEAHGLVAEKIIEVDPELADGLLGGGGVDDAGAALMPHDAGGHRDPGVRSILFTDIVGSTELTQRLGDDGAMRLIEVHDGIVREALAAEGGREVKHTGDGIMASFVSAAAAVRSACDVQRALARWRGANPESPLAVRIGLAAGEPVEQRNDLFGSTVQLAARLCADAEPGQVLVSTAVAELCIGKGLRFVDMGERRLKGFETPIRAHGIEIAC